eukprot:Lithocolla_globosa_v1_NODE_10237_length_620_cov_2.605310.p1 type:complete len:170 gc:universal NODE_10237_length_620_cov_2.605310:579-70(-)
MDGLRNSRLFPAFKDLSNYDSPWDSYHEEKDGMLTPKGHWCFMAEVIDFNFTIRPRVLVKTWTGEELVVHFYHEQSESPTTFSWKELNRKGACLAILYAKRKHFMDLTEGVRVEHLDSVFVFKAPLAVLRTSSDNILAEACYHGSCVQTKRQNGDPLLNCSACKTRKVL